LETTATAATWDKWLQVGVEPPPVGLEAAALHKAAWR
jgi:hypothetical protein